MNKIMYCNLGANSGDRNIYIRSTDIEQMKWENLLFSFPDEALYFMTKGNKIIIEDRCSKKRGKVQRIFAPAMTDFLRHLAGLKPLNKNIKQHTEKAIKCYDENKILQWKYNFFIKKLNNYTVRGRTVFMTKEPTVWKAAHDVRQ